MQRRRPLNRTYDPFVSRFGPLSPKENVRAFVGDPDQPLLLSLEEFDPDTNRATKTAVFERRTLERYRPVERVESASEALLVSLNETGRIDWPRMESLTGRSAPELQKELGNLAYQNPESREWETADCYLSGNVRSKLLDAQDAARTDSAYRRNVDALQEVQPKDLEPAGQKLSNSRFASLSACAHVTRRFRAGLRRFTLGCVMTRGYDLLVEEHCESRIPRAKGVQGFRNGGFHRQVVRLSHAQVAR